MAKSKNRARRVEPVVGAPKAAAEKTGAGQPAITPAVPPRRRPLLLALSIAVLAVWLIFLTYIAVFG